MTIVWPYLIERKFWFFRNNKYRISIINNLICNVNYMKNKKGKIIGLGVLSLFLIAGISTAFAQNGVDWETKKALIAEKKAQMEEIFKDGTYSDWVNFSNQNFEKKVTQMREQHNERINQITSENWSKFVEAHELMMSGDKEGAQVIMEELGIERGIGMGKTHKGKGVGVNGGKYYQNQN